MFRRGSDELRRMALDDLRIINAEERRSWLEHPCTRALVHTLQGDIIDILEAWSFGNYTSDTVDKTIQLNSEALGQYKAAAEIEEWIQGITDKEMFEND